MSDDLNKHPRIKLLAISQRFSGSGGGAPESLRLLSQKLSRYVTIDVLSKDGFYVDVGRECQLPEPQLAQNVQLNTEISKYALLISCGPFISPAIWIKALFILGLRKTPMVYLPRGGLCKYEFHYSNRSLLKYVYFYLIEFWIILCSNRIIYSSKLERDATRVLKSRLLFANYDIIPDPVDLGSNRRRGKVEVEKRDSRRLGFIAELHPRKSLKEVVDAFKLLDAENDFRFNLVIAGEPRASSLHYSQNILADLPRNVYYVGRVSSSKKKKFYSEIDALLVPSQFESFSLVCAEAIKYHVPIICSQNIGFLDGLCIDELNIPILKEVNAMCISEVIKNFNFSFDENLFSSVHSRDSRAVEKYVSTVKELTGALSDKIA